MLNNSLISVNITFPLLILTECFVISVATRIILLFFASLHDNLFVFSFLLFCYYLSLLALRNTPVDYVTTPYTYSFIYCACLFLLGGLLASARFRPMFCLCIRVGFYRTTSFC